jgi:hypothetical protein
MFIAAVFAIAKLWKAFWGGKQWEVGEGRDGGGGERICWMYVICTCHNEIHIKFFMKVKKRVVGGGAIERVIEG